MSLCRICGKTVYMSYHIANKLLFCSDSCKSRYDLQSITVSKPCSSCGGLIYFLEGVYFKGGNTFCSLRCVYSYNNNQKIY